MTGLPDDATVSYRYNDASVPPPYHRSVELTVTKDQTRIVIDSYGDVLADQTIETPRQVWTQLGDTLGDVQGLTVEEPVQDGCTGGTSIQVSVTAGNDLLLNLEPEFCGGSNSDLEEPIDAWIAPARDLFPPTSELAPEEP